MVFVVFYMFYSNNFFMRRRMKELGIYALLGYRKGDMLCLLTIENIFVCLGGTIVGILAGSLLHIGVTAGIVALLDLTIDMGAIPFINPQAVGSISVSYTHLTSMALAPESRTNSSSSSPQSAGCLLYTSRCV